MQKGHEVSLWGKNAARCVGIDLSFSIRVEAGGSRVQAHPQLHKKIKVSLGYKKPTLKNKKEAGLNKTFIPLPLRPREHCRRGSEKNV